MGDFKPPPTLRLVLRGEERRLKVLGFFEVSVEGGFGMGLGAVGMGGFEVGVGVEADETSDVDDEAAVNDDDAER